MRVGFLSCSAAPYGELGALARFLVERGHDAFFAAPHELALPALGVRIARFRAAASDPSRNHGAIANAAALWRLRAAVDEVFAREAPDVVVVNRDRGADVLVCAAHAARAIGAPLVAMDVGITSAAFKARTRRSSLHDARRGLNRLVAALAPGQRRVVDGKALMFYAPGKTAALAALSLLPARPWLNGESAHAHLMISERSVEDARGEGARCANASVVGLPSIDALHAAHAERAAVRAELLAGQRGQDTQGPRTEARTSSRAGSERPICVVPLPQLFEHKLLSRDAALREISAILAVALAAPGAPLVVGSLHPSMDRANYAALEREHPGFVLATAPLARVMAAADVSINAFPTTALWSLLAGAPALYLDWWQQGYDLSRQPGVVVSSDRAMLAAELASTLERAAELKRAIEADRAMLPPFDGRCRERALEALLACANAR